MMNRGETDYQRENCRSVYLVTYNSIAQYAYTTQQTEVVDDIILMHSVSFYIIILLCHSRHHPKV